MSKQVQPDLRLRLCTVDAYRHFSALTLAAEHARGWLRAGQILDNAAETNGAYARGTLAPCGGDYWGAWLRP